MEETRSRQVLTITALLALLLCISCSLASMPTDDPAPSTVSYDFQGEAPREISGAGSDDPAVRAALTELMQDRVYSYGLMERNGQLTSRRSTRLRGGPATSWGAQQHEASSLGEMEATLRAAGDSSLSGGRVKAQFQLGSGEAPPLRLELSFSRKQAHQLVEAMLAAPQSSRPEGGLDQQCVLHGILAGREVKLHFVQHLHAHASSSGSGSAAQH